MSVFPCLSDSLCLSSSSLSLSLSPAPFSAPPPSPPVPPSLSWFLCSYCSPSVSPCLSLSVLFLFASLCICPPFLPSSVCLFLSEHLSSLVSLCLSVAPSSSLCPFVSECLCFCVSQCLSLSLSRCLSVSVPLCPLLLPLCLPLPSPSLEACRLVVEQLAVRLGLRPVSSHRLLPPWWLFSNHLGRVQTVLPQTGHCHHRDPGPGPARGPACLG